MKLEQERFYVVPHLVYGDVIVVAVSTPNIDWYETGIPYDEGSPVIWRGDEWQCADWDGDRNEFVLMHFEKMLFDDPTARAEILAIVRGDTLQEPFQMELKL